MTLWRYISWLLRIGIALYILACVWVIAVLFVWVMQALRP